MNSHDCPFSIVSYVENTTVPEEPSVEAEAVPETVHINEVTLKPCQTSTTDLEAMNMT